MNDPSPSPAPPLWKSRVFILAALLALLRFAFLAFPELFPEEAYYWTYAQHLDWGYLDHPPMVAWLIALGTAIFGHTEFGVRIFAFVSSLTSAFFVFRLANLLYGRAAGLFALLLVQTLPFFFLAGIIMTPDAPLTACWAGMLYFLAVAIFEQRPAAWVGVGVCLGLGMLSKYTVALLGPATLLFLVLDPPSRFWFRRAAPYLGVALSILIFSPVIWWNAAHHWASFAFQTTGRTRVRRRFSSHELLGAILAVLTPVGAWLAAGSLLGQPSEEDTPRRRRLFARVFTLVPLAVFVLFSLTHRVKLNWTGPLWLAAVPAVAASLASLAAQQPGTRRHFALWRGWQTTVVVCGLAYLGVLIHLSFGLPGLPYSRNIELLPVGWRELTRVLEQQKASLERETGGPVYLVGMDHNFIASEVAFYQRDRAKAIRETTGRHLLGGDSLMYRYWFPPERLEGATLLLVALTSGDLKTRRVEDTSQQASTIQQATLTHRGKPIRNYYTRVVTGYHPLP